MTACYRECFGKVVDYADIELGIKDVNERRQNDERNAVMTIANKMQKKKFKD